jgi:antibiotic biosynthesis monooxygenase (ABM) superfamily enzyme
MPVCIGVGTEGLSRWESSAIVPRRAFMSKTTLIATASVFVLLALVWYFLVR